ncbi:MAG: class II fructose-bisphosphate aldolase [Candidatus Levybacteria bacterium]|nr:class II fructose-bisphosphate aldolase [Candidatus Levybacteria bacterium]
MTLKDLHLKAKKEHWAVPHFNFSSYSQLLGIIKGASQLRAPVLAGTSEGEREFIGIKQAVDIIKSLRESNNIPIFLNADHCHSVESAKIAFDAGYDSIHIDLSKKPFKENLEGTKQVVDYVKSKNPEVEVEGELGYLATDSSKVYNEVIEIPQDSYTKIDEAILYVQQTGIDRFAPAIGNMHGISVRPKKIRFDLIEELRKALPANLTFTLHGGSGTDALDLKKIVEMGFNNIHISTEIRVAYTNALREALAKDVNETTPYKYLALARDAVAELVIEKLKIYNTVNVI